MRIFLSHVTSPEHIAKYHLSVAGYNFCTNLNNGGVFDRVYTIMPSMVREEVVLDNVCCLYSRIRKTFFYRFAQFFEQFFLFRTLSSETSLWLYNVTIQNALLIILLRVFRPNIKVFAIVLDYTPIKNSFSFQNLYLRLINVLDGRICLSNSSLFNSKNSITIPGVVPSNRLTYEIISAINNRFLLSGVLTENISMLGTVLETFSRLPNTHLIITGFLSDDEIIKDYASRYSNISYYGLVSMEEYLDILDSVTYVLSTRDPAFPENQCNFPSKIIESLLHNRAIVSTIEYQQLRGVNYYIIGSDVETMVYDINRICISEESERKNYINQGYIIADMCSVNRWKEACELLERNS